MCIYGAITVVYRIPIYTYIQWTLGSRECVSYIAYIIYVILCILRGEYRVNKGDE